MSTRRRHTIKDSKNIKLIGTYRQFELSTAQHERVLNDIIQGKLFDKNYNSSKLNRLAIDYYNLRLSLTLINEKFSVESCTEVSQKYFFLGMFRDLMIKRHKILKQINRLENQGNKGVKDAMQDVKRHIIQIEKNMRKIASPEIVESYRNKLIAENTIDIISRITRYDIDNSNRNKDIHISTISLTGSNLEYDALSKPVRMRFSSLFSINMNIYHSFRFLVDRMKDINLEKIRLCNLVYNTGTKQFSFEITENTSGLDNLNLKLTNDEVNLISKNLNSLMKLFNHYYLPCVMLRYDYDVERVEDIYNYVKTYFMERNEGGSESDSEGKWRPLKGNSGSASIDTLF